MKYLSAVLLLLSFISPAFAAPSPAGEWLSFYKNTDMPSAKINVTLDNQNQLNAYIVEAYPKPGEAAPTICTACPADFNNKPLKNMPLLWDLKPKGHKWVDGHGISIEEKRLFSATVWLSDDGNTLFVEGKIGFIGKTQQFKRFTSGK